MHGSTLIERSPSLAVGNGRGLCGGVLEAGDRLSGIIGRSSVCGSPDASWNGIAGVRLGGTAFHEDFPAAFFARENCVSGTAITTLDTAFLAGTAGVRTECDSEEADESEENVGSLHLVDVANRV